MLKIPFLKFMIFVLLILVFDLNKPVYSKTTSPSNILAEKKSTIKKIISNSLEESQINHVKNWIKKSEELLKNINYSVPTDLSLVIESSGEMGRFESWNNTIYSNVRTDSPNSIERELGELLHEYGHAIFNTIMMQKSDLIYQYLMYYNEYASLTVGLMKHYNYDIHAIPTMIENYIKMGELNKAHDWQQDLIELKNAKNRYDELEAKLANLKIPLNTLKAYSELVADTWVVVILGNLKSMRIALEDPNEIIDSDVNTNAKLEARDYSLNKKSFDTNKTFDEYEISSLTKSFLGQRLEGKSLSERVRIFDLLIEAILKDVNNWNYSTSEKSVLDFNKFLIDFMEKSNL